MPSTTPPSPLSLHDALPIFFSHPWIYPLVKDVLRRRAQLVVYESHNVEGLLRMRLLGDNPFGSRIAAHAAAIERELCHAADLVRSEEHTSELQSRLHLVCRQPPRPPLFPYTTLFRSSSRIRGSIRWSRTSCGGGRSSSSTSRTTSRGSSACGCSATTRSGRGSPRTPRPSSASCATPPIS